MTAITWRCLVEKPVKHAIPTDRLHGQRVTALCGVGWWVAPNEWDLPAGSERECKRCSRVLSTTAEESKDA